MPTRASSKSFSMRCSGTKSVETPSSASAPGLCCRAQSSKRSSSRPRNVTPAGPSARRTPQYFSLGWTRWTRTRVPASIDPSEDHACHEILRRRDAPVEERVRVVGRDVEVRRRLAAGRREDHLHLLERFARRAGLLQAARRRHEREENLLLAVRHGRDAQGGGKASELDALHVAPVERAHEGIADDRVEDDRRRVHGPRRRAGGAGLPFGHELSDPRLWAVGVRLPAVLLDVLRKGCLLYTSPSPR